MRRRYQDRRLVIISQRLPQRSIDKRKYVPRFVAFQPLCLIFNLIRAYFYHEDVYTYLPCMRSNVANNLVELLHEQKISMIRSCKELLC